MTLPFPRLKKLQKLILVVEDDLAIREMVVDAFAKAGFDTGVTWGKPTNRFQRGEIRLGAIWRPRGSIDVGKGIGNGAERCRKFL